MKKYFFITYFFACVIVNATVGIQLGNISVKDVKNNDSTVKTLTEELIIDVKVKSVGVDFATIYWKTAGISTIDIRYGENLPPDKNIVEMEKGNEHTVLIEKLKSGTKYKFVIKGKEDFYGEFRTLGLKLPELKSISNLKKTKISLSFDLVFDDYVKGKIEYFPENIPEQKKEFFFNNYKKETPIELLNLNSNESYQIKVFGENMLGDKIIPKTYNFTTKENNVALCCDVKGTFEFLRENMRGSRKREDVLRRIVDGKTDFFEGITVSGNIKEDDQWVELDLKTIIDLKKIVVYWRKLAYSTDYKIESSIDKKNWILIEDNINAEKGIEKRSETGDPMLILNHNLDNIKARFIKLTCKKNKYKVKHLEWEFLQLNEIKVFQK